jgi:hypothetical protein
MTPVEIAYLKHFLYDKGISQSFVYYYRKNPILGSHANPESIEQYFLQASVKDVIMKAFIFYPSGAATKESSTFDYWKAIDDQWQQYMDSMADNFSNDSWPLLRKTFAILRQNWDLPAYWCRGNFESTEEVYERMHINLPLPEFRWQHGYLIVKPLQNGNAEQILDAKDGDVIVRIHTCETHVSRLIILFHDLQPYEVDGVQMYKATVYAYFNCRNNRLKIGGDANSILINPESTDVHFRKARGSEAGLLMQKLEEAGLKRDEEQKSILPLNKKQDQKDESHDDVPEIDFVEFDKSRRLVNTLTSGIISVNSRGHSWRVTVNRTDTKEIKKKQVRYAMVGNTSGGETMLMFCNNSNGIPITYKTDHYYNINSRQFCEHLKRLLSVSDDLAYLRIKKVSEKIDSITYKVTKQ